MRTNTKIKIIKSRSTSLWYRNMIGKTIDVKDTDKDYYIAKSKGNMEKIIYKEDTEKI